MRGQVCLTALSLFIENQFNLFAFFVFAFAAFTF